ncbi:histidine kinase,Response regulator receiver domain protein,histidine kinase [Desulfosporosinus orientis DSM 765]|uniref:Stage 0 sporulation protein A homolog n=1 Tax=Desulfosporosinus orientis (strain ATCC 19365 / DSM 765 / NCIMB 8382 / VKM B-1628 / Singapore I) TaxID=768706 RepID=G7WFC7_DESOD|nr:ATP-binding protein [Desulfosporosinus orientis]AET68013.1 histidine kinase,Response regulator receiver domain protein,histidine kinase [Desulfosporosinus orientis DSM 765]
MKKTDFHNDESNLQPDRHKIRLLKVTQRKQCYTYDGQVRRERERSTELQRSNEKLKTEIEEIKRNETELQESRNLIMANIETMERFRALFEHMNEGFFLAEMICDDSGKPLDYRYIDSNPVFERVICKKKHEDIVGRMNSEIQLFPSDWIETFTRVAMNGCPECFEGYSDDFNLYLQINAFSPGKGQFACLVQDITERKQAEESLRKADENKNLFLSSLSHELRNPLASMMMSISLLKVTSPDLAKTIQAIESLERQTLHLSRLVDDLLEVTRISQNKIETKKQRIELNDLVSGIVRDKSPLFSDKGVALEVDTFSKSIYLQADPSRLTQVLGNLLHNALKFTDEGGNTQVRITEDEDTNEVIVEIQDDGCGIKPELLPDLFKPFTQANAALERNGGGLGLGLAIAKGIIGLHGGSVSASSEGLGKGSLFTVRLPLAQNEETNPKTSLKESVKTTRSLQILVIDDIPDVAEILRSLLQYLGHEVITASDGPEGLKKAIMFKPEVIFCDIGLPMMNGYEVAENIRKDEQTKDIFMIALSGYAQIEDLKRAKEAGFNQHLAKPVDLDGLKQILTEISDNGQS